MERKTKFRHLHGGHPRNANPYSFYREKMRKVKYPFIALSTFLLIFFSFDGVGEFSKVDVLNSGGNSDIVFTAENLEIAKKGMLVFVNDEQKECEALNLEKCASEAKNFAAVIAVLSDPEEARQTVVSLDEAVTRWDAEQKQTACEQNASAAVENLENAIRFAEKSGAENVESLKDDLEDLRSSQCS